MLLNRVRTISLEATPLPCLNNKLECHWIESSDFRPSLRACSFQNLLIDDGRKLVLATPELITLGERGAIFLLPEKCLEVNYRRTRRHPCQGIRVGTGTRAPRSSRSRRAWRAGRIQARR